MVHVNVRPPRPARSLVACSLLLRAHVSCMHLLRATLWYPALFLHSSLLYPPLLLMSALELLSSIPPYLVFRVSYPSPSPVSSFSVAFVAASLVPLPATALPAKSLPVLDSVAPIGLVLTVLL